MLRAGVLAVALAAAVAPAPSGWQPGARSSQVLRFHHLHYRAADPSESLRHAAAMFQGTRVLLRGLGVGVRIGDEYVLFDRADGTERDGGSPATAYAGAVAWIRAHGLPGPADGTARGRIAAAFPESFLDHAAFTAADLPRAVETLRAHGARPVRETDHAALFHAANGIAVEIVRDTDAADAYWCPMHPDLRSSVAGKCPLCGMPLVRMPAQRIGEYRMDVAVTAAARGGATKLRLTLRDPETGQPVAAFATVHDRLLHLFIIDRTLEYFAHVHPRPAGEGIFEIDQPLPPGAYVVVADFLPLSGPSQTVQRAIVTPGYRGPLFPAPPPLASEMGTDKVVAGVRVRLEPATLTAGREAVLRFRLAEVSTGAPVSDLEPFLGAAGHMLVVNADLTEAHHAHPEEQAARGPVVEFQPRMPAAGLYKLWVQFQRKGQVITVPFAVPVREP